MGWSWTHPALLSPTTGGPELSASLHRRGFQWHLTGQNPTIVTITGRWRDPKPTALGSPDWRELRLAVTVCKVPGSPAPGAEMNPERTAGARVIS